jgi:sugar lactone lactonase YvrE
MASPVFNVNILFKKMPILEEKNLLAMSDIHSYCRFQIGGAETCFLVQDVFNQFYERRQFMKPLPILGLVLVFCFTSIAFAGDIKVINAKSGFPEGPLWHNDMLYYAEYGSQMIKTWDGKQNQEFWKMDGCGPSAIVALSAGDFLVACYDSGSIARVSAEGKTITEYKQDREGRRFQGPNDFVAGKKGGVYFTASGPWERKLVKTIDVPSTAAPNLSFGADEAVVYIMAVDDQNNAPYWGKVYEVPNK